MSCMLHKFYFIPFIPPEKPLQLANTMRGRRSRLKSQMTWAVLKAESGNHTWPACCMTWNENTEIQANVQSSSSLYDINIWRVFVTLDSESRLAGSAGTVNSTVRVSTAMTPRGIPPNLCSYISIINQLDVHFSNVHAAYEQIYRALPTTTVWAQDPMISMNEPWSKNPLCQVPFTTNDTKE